MYCKNISINSKQIKANDVLVGTLQAALLKIESMYANMSMGSAISSITSEMSVSHLDPKSVANIYSEYTNAYSKLELNNDKIADAYDNMDIANVGDEEADKILQDIINPKPTLSVIPPMPSINIDKQEIKNEEEHKGPKEMLYA